MAPAPCTPSATAPASVLCGICGDCTLSATGRPSAAAAATASCALATRRDSTNRIPYSARIGAASYSHSTAPADSSMAQTRSHLASSTERLFIPQEAEGTQGRTNLTLTSAYSVSAASARAQLRISVQSGKPASATIDAVSAAGTV